MGIKTWVSLEPVLMPAASLAMIHLLNDMVDHWKVGKLNYHPRAKEIDWHQFASEVKRVLDGHGCDYYIKKDLAAYLSEPNKPKVSLLQ